MVFGKKGLETEQLVILVIAVFVLISMLSFVNLASNFLNKKSVEQTCQLSVLAHSNSQLVDGSPLLSLNCPRKIVKFSKEGYTEYHAKSIENSLSDSVTTLYRTDDPNEIQEIVYSKLAEEMGNCWYKMGEGKMDVFSNSGFISGTKASCLICSEISFTNDFPNNVDLGKIKDFSNYVEVENYTKYNLNIPYSKYLYGKYSAYLNPTFMLNSFAFIYRPEKTPQIYEDNTDNIDASKNYVIFYKGIKFDLKSKIISYVGESIPGLSGVVPSEDMYFVFFSTPDKLNNQCYMLVN